MSDRVVLLGSTGFAGAAIMRELGRREGVDAEGHASASIDLTSPESPARLGRIADENSILISAVRPRPSGDSFETFTKDLAISANLARFLSGRRIRKLVHFSTVSVYDDEVTNMAITERTPVAPASLYGIARLAGEYLLRECAERSGSPVVILRSCKIYGPGDTSGGYGPAGFIESILKEGKVRLFGDGRELRDLLYIEDLAGAAARFALGEACGTYNLVTGESHSFRDILDHLRHISGVEIEVVSRERSKPRVDQKFDTSALMAAVPGFRFIGLEEGLRRTLEDFRGQYSEKR